MSDGDGNSVLLVHHRDLFSPIGTTLSYYLANELSGSHTVHVVCRRTDRERSEGADPPEAELHDVYTGEVPLVSTILFHLLSTLYVAVLAARHRYDVTYCFQSSVIQGWVGARIAGSRFVVGLASVPVRQRQDFSTFSGGSTDLRTLISMWLLRLYSGIVGVLLARCSAVVALTQGILDVTEAFYGIDLSNAHVIGMGVDVEAFPPPRGRGQRGADGWTMTYVGSLTDTRNLEQVLEAMARLDHDLTFRIAGAGSEEYVQSLLATAERLGVADRVEWLGLVPHAEIPALLSESDLSVSPLPDIESFRVSFPAKLLEYMAAGSVVVATDLPAHRELVDDGSNGFLYDGSLEGLVEVIERCLDDEDLDEVRRRARATAEEHDWDRIVRRHEAVLFGSQRDPAEAPNP